MKILTVIGARPQFIKAAALSRVIEADARIEEIFIHTGQHYDANMSEVFFEEMQIKKPKYNLNIRSNFHGEMTGTMMTDIEKIALQESPDWILVYGDTNSTLAGALVASKLGVKLAHVEAGLRSFNNYMPEEINRIVTDRLSNLLFCPTDNAVSNLLKEGYANLADKKIVNVGDIMLDASMYYSNFEIDFPHNLSNFVLATIHRPVNTDNPKNLLEILKALDNIGSNNGKVLFPVHPRTRSKIEILDKDYISSFSNILFVTPLSYFEIIYALKNCSMVITDSGGLQKEAYFFKKPCLTLREETEWVELVEHGYNILCSIDAIAIAEKANKIKSSSIEIKDELYGSGRTAELILENILAF